MRISCLCSLVRVSISLFKAHYLLSIKLSGTAVGRSNLILITPSSILITVAILTMIKEKVPEIVDDIPLLNRRLEIMEV